MPKSQLPADKLIKETVNRGRVLPFAYFVTSKKQVTTPMARPPWRALFSCH